MNRQAKKMLIRRDVLDLYCLSGGIERLSRSPMLSGDPRIRTLERLVAELENEQLAALKSIGATDGRPGNGLSREATFTLLSRLAPKRTNENTINQNVQQ